MPTPGIVTNELGRRAINDTSGCMKKYAIRRSMRGRDPEEEREALHRAGREHVQHPRAEQRDEVGGDDRAERSRGSPPSSDERTVLPDADLVLQPLEVHDIRVDGDTDRDDDARSRPPA